MPNEIISCLASLILILAFAGCRLIPETKGHWTHPSNSKSQIMDDHYSCAEEVWVQYPKKMGMISAENGYWKPAKNASSVCIYSDLSHKYFCSYVPATSGEYVAPDIIKGDENANSRFDAYAKCMTTKDSQYKCVKNGTIVNGGFCGNHQD